MDTGKQISYLTFLLALVAGYCDTVTFVAGDAIFSAHVTGNFIVFAAQVMLGPNVEAFVKLLTFPVFVAAVMIGGWAIARFIRPHLLLHIQTVLLLVTGALAFALQYSTPDAGKWPAYLIVMLVVVAMGLQNAYGKLFAKDTYGPTTMMTGNVTQASLDLRKAIQSKFTDALAIASLKKQSVNILGFLAGCLLGAVAGKSIGLPSIIFAGIVMAIGCRIGGQKNAEIASPSATI